MTNKYRCTTAL